MCALAFGGQGVVSGALWVGVVRVLCGGGGEGGHTFHASDWLHKGHRRVHGGVQQV